MITSIADPAHDPSALCGQVREALLGLPLERPALPIPEDLLKEVGERAVYFPVLSRRFSVQKAGLRR